MGLLYLSVALLQARPRALQAWRRRSYAGFYLDESYTRVALALWPALRADHGAPRPSMRDVHAL
jgi:NAD(P)H-quinone oxidoreductase subunit 5